MTRAEQLLCELIALPSVNPAFLPARHPHSGEHRVADYVVAWAASAGLDVEFQTVAPRRRNVLCRLLPKEQTQHRIFLAPHLDTVNIVSEAQLSPVRKGNRIYGRGACDTKGSAAAMLVALANVARSGRRPKHTEIVFTGLVDEECAQAGSRKLAASRMKADLAIVGEPTRLKVVTAHKGNVWLQVETKGRAAHGATPHLGRNAVHEMARVVDSLETGYRAQLKRRRHKLLGQPTVSVGTISGGSQANIVPDSCAIQVDRRILPGETDRTTQIELKRFLKAHGFRTSVKSTKGVFCPPLETPLNTPFVSEFMKVAGQKTGEGVHFFCDAAILAGGDIPSVVFGPGNIAQAHTSDEWISTTQLERACDLLVRFLRSVP